MSDRDTHGAARRDALDGITQLVVDGNNLLHRVRGTGDEAAQRWLVPHLRDWRPPGLRILVVLDGHPAGASGPRRVAVPGLELRHAGAVSADEAIVRHVAARPWGERGQTIVVTDDRSLADRVRHVGALPRRLDWLIDQLGGPAGRPAGAVAGAAIGAGAPRRRPDTRQDEIEREPWRPGRGATRKRGNPARRHR